MENKRNRKDTIYGKGINDTEIGWFGETEENKKIYYLWSKMIRRCYDEKTLEKRPTYKNVSVCEEWIYLSNFANDVKTLKNYDLWLNNDGYQLDKDILCDKLGITDKIYSKETCQFITLAENTKYMLDKRDYSYMQGENHSNYGKHLSDETKQKISMAMMGKANPMYGKPIPNKEQLIEINKRKVVAKRLSDNTILKFNSIKEAADSLSKIENTNVNKSQIAKICKYNKDPEGYYAKFKKRAKQNKGYTFYYEEDYNGDE